jgi:hypothetical protein
MYFSTTLYIVHIEAALRNAFASRPPGPATFKLIQMRLKDTGTVALEASPTGLGCLSTQMQSYNTLGLEIYPATEAAYKVGPNVAPWKHLGSRGR